MKLLYRRKLKMIVSIAAVTSQKNIIGVNGTIPWHSQIDFKHFKSKTQNNACIMGKDTYESIPITFRPLPGRLTIVVTSLGDNYNVPDGVLCATSLQDAISKIALTEYKDRDIYLCGGQRIYEEGMSLAQRLEITWVMKEIQEDRFEKVAYFPEIDPQKWVWNTVMDPYEENDLKFQFVTYDLV